MLATRLEDPRRLTDPRYIAEPKLDGQRTRLGSPSAFLRPSAHEVHDQQDDGHGQENVYQAPRQVKYE
jgi:hypothetical protein